MSGLDNAARTAMRRCSHEAVVAVTFDRHRGYIATHPELGAPITALSLTLLRRRVEDQLVGENLDVRLVLDKRADVCHLIEIAGVLTSALKATHGLMSRKEQKL